MESKRYTGASNTTRAQAKLLVEYCTEVLENEDLTANQEEIVKSVLASMVAAEGRPYPKVELVFPLSVNAPFDIFDESSDIK